MSIPPVGGPDMPDPNSEEYQKFAKSFQSMMKQFMSMLSESLDINLSGDPSQGFLKDEEEEE